MIRGSVAWICALTLFTSGVDTASGQNTYPSKTIRVVTTAAGSGSDYGARLIADGLAAALGQPVIIDNRGGSGVIPVETVIKAPPDGYTLLFIGTTLWAASLFQPNVTFDAAKDLVPITLAVSAPNILVVHPSMPVGTVRELIALAKSRPGKLNYGSGQSSSTNHLSAELFKSMSGVNIVRIPYKGTTGSFTALMSGEIDMMFMPAAPAAPHLKSGRLKALAITSARPSEIVPGLPTVAETLPGYESVAQFGLSAPAGTPVGIISRLNRETVRVINLPDTRRRFVEAGEDIIGSSPEEYASVARTETARLIKLIKDAGIRPDGN